jgi:hypothetical protein
MLIELFNKIFLFLFFLCSLNITRVLYFLIQKWIDNEKFKLSERSLFLLGISISYVLLCIFNGIKI